MPHSSVIGVFAVSLAFLCTIEFFKMRTPKNDLRRVEFKFTNQLPKIDVKVKSPEHCIQIFRDIWEDPLFDLQEQVHALFLDFSDNLLCWRRLGAGSYKSCIVDTRLLLRIALDCNSFKVVIAHNHPCGTAEPSIADEHLTERVMLSCAAADIELLDHLILTRAGFYSFRMSDNILV